MVHHIDLSVSDLERARAFYALVLGFIGYSRAEDTADGSDWVLMAAGSFQSIGIVATRGAGANCVHDRYAPGLHHLAWSAERADAVDALHALLVEHGADILHPPAYYPEYGPDYYAVFFLDPDGIKLEYVAGRTAYALQA